MWWMKNIQKPNMMRKWISRRYWMLIRRGSQPMKNLSVGLPTTKENIAKPVRISAMTMA